MNPLLFNDQTKARNQIRSWKFDEKKERRVTKRHWNIYWVPYICGFV